MEWLLILRANKFLDFKNLFDIVSRFECLVEGCIWLLLSEVLGLFL